MVRERRFRADLYYRLNVFPMTLPPLRERRDDIALLTEYFVRKFAGQQGKVVATIPRDVMAALEHYDWPGNIRELQNVIERGVIMTTGSVLSRQTTELLTTARSCAGPFSSGGRGDKHQEDDGRCRACAYHRNTSGDQLGCRWAEWSRSATGVAENNLDVQNAAAWNFQFIPKTLWAVD